MIFLSDPHCTTNSSTHTNFDIFPTLPEDIDRINQFLNQEETLSSEEIARFGSCDDCCHSRNKLCEENGKPIVCFRMKLPGDDLSKLLSADATAADNNEAVGPMVPTSKKS